MRFLPARRNPQLRTAQKRRAYRAGLGAETLACLLLLLKGYRILHRRLKTPLGEIDLVALRHRTLVFVEVKARPTLDEAALSLQRRQQFRLIRAARFYLMGHPRFAKHDQRFDAILVAPWRWPHHILSAWDAS